MRQRYTQVATQKAAGQSFYVEFQPPGPDVTMRVLHLSVEIPNYASGNVSAVVTLQPSGLFICGTSQGQQDSAEGPLDVFGSETLRVTWNPTRVPGIVQGRAFLLADVGHAA